MFIASLLTKSVKDFSFFASQAGLVQYNDCTSPTCFISVGALQTGQASGIRTESLLVRFSAIWGIIIFAL